MAPSWKRTSTSQILFDKIRRALYCKVLGPQGLTALRPSTPRTLIAIGDRARAKEKENGKGTGIKCLRRGENPLGYVKSARTPRIAITENTKVAARRYCKESSSLHQRVATVMPEGAL